MPPRTRRGVHLSAIFAIGLLILAIFLRPGMEQFRQRKAVSELERMKGARYQWEWATSNPAWMFDHFKEIRKHRGDWVVGASVWNFSFLPSELKSLQAIPHLRRLSIGSFFLGGPSFPLGGGTTHPIHKGFSISTTEAIEDFSQLERLDVQGLSRGTLIVRNCRKLTQVSIIGFYDARVEISDLPNLVELTLTTGSDNFRFALSAVPNLRRLSMIGGSSFVDEGVFTLHDLPGLESISLNAVRIRAVDLVGLPDLRHLCIRQSQLDDVGITGLSSLHELQSLQLFHCALSDAGLAKLDNLPELEFLEMRGTNVTTAGLAALGRFPRLRELTLDWSMTAIELEELQRALPGVIIDSPFRLKNKVPEPAVIALQCNESSR